MIANTVVDIWRAEGVEPIFKSEDNLAPLHTPVTQGPHSDSVYTYAYNKEEILRRVEPLWVPWHPEKGTPEFVSAMVLIGLLCYGC
ncbi:hypothetical protein P691DRAFT_690794 [Macrolepiota fuliginosa MF-IS2]|uniref:Uncharacterized protein n=1 Tax=Macrolepiota fuliginosa MF-IS2 TaxID=1400762 RepID=A0A9P5WWC3_9AGAR|nr:hypothetical protein P691DRAFT_690794 [Macrolepiota fuliginosa MF-IS2]